MLPKTLVYLILQPLLDILNRLLVTVSHSASLLPHNNPPPPLNLEGGCDGFKTKIYISVINIIEAQI